MFSDYNNEVVEELKARAEKAEAEVERLREYLMSPKAYEAWKAQREVGE